MSARPTLHFVVYDICDPKRLRRVHRTLRGYGDPVQLSVFLCHLTPLQLAELRAELEAIVAATEDQVLLLPLGKQRERILERILSVGRTLEVPGLGARIF